MKQWNYKGHKSMVTDTMIAKANAAEGRERMRGYEMDAYLEFMTGRIMITNAVPHIEKFAKRHDIKLMRQTVGLLQRIAGQFFDSIDMAQCISLDNQWRNVVISMSARPVTGEGIVDQNINVNVADIANLVNPLIESHCRQCLKCGKDVVNCPVRKSLDVIPFARMDLNEGYVVDGMCPYQICEVKKRA